ncbi:MAG: hypothetical protein M3R36_14975 [Bacteroidota bacterium]|nr:hypothetical protein [Bacteroidota bacterium]
MASLDSKGLRKFISKYANKVAPEYIEDIKQYSNACIYFKEKSFEKCLEQLSTNDLLNFPTMKTSKQTLKICCLYELSYFENVLSTIDSFEHFLRNNKNVSEIIKTENF